METGSAQQFRDNFPAIWERERRFGSWSHIMGIDLGVDLSRCSALVIETSQTMRSIIFSQLRELGVGAIVHAPRPVDARKILESRRFDFVLCDMDCYEQSYSGRDLLDDLRRNHILPLTTVFVLISSGATLSAVSEVAESALDVLLIKPHKGVHLAERLFAARARKVELGEIFKAIEASAFEQAAQLCMRRYYAKGRYWLYSARIGAELLLRTGNSMLALELYKEVVQARTMPWARLGIARAQFDNGQSFEAVGTLERLLSDEPLYVDAYDVMGRALFDLGRFHESLEAFQIAVQITPHSIGRIQNLAMMTYYAGHKEEAIRLLEETRRVGVDSKLFDLQVLVLLSFLHLEQGNQIELQRCRDDAQRILQRSPEIQRSQRLSECVFSINHIGQNHVAQSLVSIRRLAENIRSSDFDFESASNLMALICQLVQRGVMIEKVDDIVRTIGMRFCCNRIHTDLLLTSSKEHPPFAKILSACHDKVLEYAETAMSLILSGNPAGAVKELVLRGRETLNARLIDNAHQVLQKHAEKINAHEDLATDIRVLRESYRMGKSKARIGNGTDSDKGASIFAFTSNSMSRPHDTSAPEGVRQ